MKKILLILLMVLSISCTTDTAIQEEVIKVENNVNVWTDGIIPFAFTDNMPNAQKEIILDAMATYESFLNVNYVEYSVDELLSMKHGMLIKFTGDNTVQSSVYPSGMPEYISDFRVGGIRWFEEKDALHELGHNLGRRHEQQVANASSMFIINYDNILERWKANFNLTNTIFATAVEPESHMSYGSYDCSINQDLPTSTRLDGSTFTPSDTLTELDKLKYIELYGSKLEK